MDSGGNEKINGEQKSRSANARDVEMHDRQIQVGTNEGEGDKGEGGGRRAVRMEPKDKDECGGDRVRRK